MDLLETVRKIHLHHCGLTLEPTRYSSLPEAADNMPKTTNLPPDDPVAGATMPGPRDTHLTGLFKTIVEATSAALFIVEDSRCIYANPAFELLTGYTREELCMTNVFDLFSAATPILLDEALTRVNGQSPQIPFEAQVLTKNGDPRWVSLTIAPFGDVPGSCFLGTAQDISFFKDRETALTYSELKYRTAFEFAPDLLVIYQPDGTPIDVNPAGVEMLGYQNDEDPERMGVYETWSEEQKAEFEKIREETLTNGQWFGDIVGIRPDGGTFIVQTHAKVAELLGDTVIVVTSRDVTERKKMEEQLRALLREKEMLLREIHHRVKNNMQIISTLLKLQLKNSRDKRTKALFRESQNRILSMALIHEKLYQSKGLHRIDLRDYVEDLAGAAFASFRDSSERIDLRLDIENVAFSMDTAIPCGLIIIELLSNSLKYAFPAEKTGEIFIGLRSRGVGSYELMVQDNGVGLPKGFELHRLRSLGLRLVSDLAKYQLNGMMDISSDPEGTIFRVNFQDRDKSGERHA